MRSGGSALPREVREPVVARQVPERTDDVAATATPATTATPAMTATTGSAGRPGTPRNVEAYTPHRLPATSAADLHDPRAEGFALLDRIQALRHEQPAEWSGDLDAIESLVWRLLFLDHQD